MLRDEWEHQMGVPSWWSKKIFGADYYIKFCVLSYELSKINKYYLFTVVQFRNLFSFTPCWSSIWSSVFLSVVSMHMRNPYYWHVLGTKEQDSPKSHQDSYSKVSSFPDCFKYLPHSFHICWRKIVMMSFFCGSLKPP